jgi:hypothetical protein
MKLRLDPSISIPAIPDPARPGKPPEGIAAAGDDIRLSTASAALNRSPRIEQLTALVQGGSYQASSAATSSAIVEDALSGGK